MSDRHPKKCVVPECDRDVVTREWCGAHYQRGLKSGEIQRLMAYSSSVCMVEGCERPRKGDGRKCVAHAYRSAAWGDAREWLNDPSAFFAWVDANLGPRPDRHTLDRIDNDGNYEPGNLRWATAQEQQANTRRSRPLTAEQLRTDRAGTMRRALAATVLAGVFVFAAPEPVEAHSIRCAAYVGNPCYQQAAWHEWLHRVLANPLGLGR